MISGPIIDAKTYIGVHYCDNCAREFDADGETPVRYEMEYTILFIWMFCCESCREDFKSRE